MDLPAPPLSSRRRLGDRVGDTGLRLVTGAAALGSVVLVGLIAWKLVDGAWPSIRTFGISFLWHTTWDPVASHFGALYFVYGTAVTSFVAVLIAGPLAIAVALFLSELAPPWLRGIVGSLVELLAAIPSVVLGLWGILVLGPFVRNTLEPWLGSWLGFLPIFQGDHNQAGMLPAVLVLTIMIVPITASISRELFLTVPRDLKEGAYALGLTRWEMVRGVILPYARGGLMGAVLLGMGRAIGEAIAVTQVIGGNFNHLPTSLFQTGDTLAGHIAAEYQGAVSNLHVASLVYLALILLVFALVTNALAQWIVHRVDRVHA